mmetsp:Transcript_44521/g.123256  ORF Transcript_44521/g.123256 Transcript_44521/m.123256 type:complete len:631 (+) Transcript_44521:85-1977(+)
MECARGAIVSARTLTALSAPRCTHAVPLHSAPAARVATRPANAQRGEHGEGPRGSFGRVAAPAGEQRADRRSRRGGIDRIEREPPAIALGAEPARGALAPCRCAGGRIGRAADDDRGGAGFGRARIARGRPGVRRVGQSFGHGAGPKGTFLARLARTTQHPRALGSRGRRRNGGCQHPADGGRRTPPRGGKVGSQGACGRACARRLRIALVPCRLHLACRRFPGGTSRTSSLRATGRLAKAGRFRSLAAARQGAGAVASLAVGVHAGDCRTRAPFLVASRHRVAVAHASKPSSRCAAEDLALAGHLGRMAQGRGGGQGSPAGPRARVAWGRGLTGLARARRRQLVDPVGWGPLFSQAPLGYGAVGLRRLAHGRARRGTPPARRRSFGFPPKASSSSQRLGSLAALGVPACRQGVGDRAAAAKLAPASLHGLAARRRSAAAWAGGRAVRRAAVALSRVPRITSPRGACAWSKVIVRAGDAAPGHVLREAFRCFATVVDGRRDLARVEACSTGHIREPSVTGLAALEASCAAEAQAVAARRRCAGAHGTSAAVGHQRLGHHCGRRAVAPQPRCYNRWAPAIHALPRGLVWMVACIAGRRSRMSGTHRRGARGGASRRGRAQRRAPLCERRAR